MTPPELKYSKNKEYRRVEVGEYPQVGDIVFDSDYAKEGREVTEYGTEWPVHGKEKIYRKIKS